MVNAVCTICLSVALGTSSPIMNFVTTCTKYTHTSSVPSAGNSAFVTPSVLFSFHMAERIAASVRMFMSVMYGLSPPTAASANS